MSHNTSPKKKRPLLRYIAIATLVLFVAPVFVVATTLAVTGTVTVEVEDDGTDLYIPVPALLFDAAIWLLPRVVEPEELAAIGEDIEPWRPALDTVADGLASCPRGVLVDARTGDDRVRVIKHRRTYEVSVTSPDTKVRVRVPARLMRRSLDLLG